MKKQKKKNIKTLTELIDQKYGKRGNKKERNGKKDLRSLNYLFSSNIYLHLKIIPSKLSHKLQVHARALLHAPRWAEGIPNYRTLAPNV